jgi:hypothetical protein
MNTTSSLTKEIAMRTYHQHLCSDYRVAQEYAENLCVNLTSWLKRKSRRISDEYVEAALILMRIDLETVRPFLESLYSPNPRGRKPYDPVCMLRSLLLMMLLKYTSITEWAKELKAKPRLAVMSGFATNSREGVKTPSAGAFYLFIDRLEDGEYRKPCEHYVKPSKLRKTKQLRHLKSEKERREHDKKTDLAEYDSVTKKLKHELKAKEDQPRPDDLMKRLEDILIQCAIIPSAEKGLLGDTKSLILSGDGSTLVTGASPHGNPSCDCGKNGVYNCDCPRYYSDSTADWGYDSYRDCYYFGHTFYQHVVSTNGHDLPVHVSISRASETDFTLSMKDMDRLTKALREHGLEWKVDNAVYDATGIYEYLMEDEITPIIALNPRSGKHPAPTGSAERVNENGIPICPGGELMRRHGYSSVKHRIYYNCPVKRPNGKGEWIARAQECPLGVLCSQDTKMGPVVYVKTTGDPRLYPPITRASPEYKKLMNLRSGCERSNSMKKNTYGLGKRPCRSDTHFLVRLYLVSIIQHAKAWLAEDRKKMGDDPTDLMNARAA